MWTKENMPDLTGKISIVTGANTGIGYETALALYQSGAHVVLACRNVDSAEQALIKMKEQEGKGSLETAVLDLSDLAAIKVFAENFLLQHNQLHILINNAGVMIPPASKTNDGFELQFGTNFIGHFALTGHLYKTLNATPESRIVTVSSQAYLNGKINFGNLRSEADYDPTREYAQSKLANILFSLELQRRIEATGGQTISIAAQPGANKTELVRHMSDEAYQAALERFGELMDPWQGALPSLYAATASGAEAGQLYGPDGEGGYKGYPAKSKLEPHALDETVALKLWEYAEKATGIYFPA